MEGYDDTDDYHNVIKLMMKYFGFTYQQTIDDFEDKKKFLKAYPSEDASIPKLHYCIPGKKEIPHIQFVIIDGKWLPSHVLYEVGFAKYMIAETFPHLDVSILRKYVQIH